ncbi:hypothetical protein Dda_6622 [Drechslerella dactyloides]|uniref:Uncharacterized protein n=1 Tax=Drechslerella dactyloides TaxID=74499 RepID=A0AAD6IU95_DREDA|nr:hypothetical protein Dda_6622 [Drechslerella dactyloides]
MSTTQEDYFGDAIDSDASARRHRRSRQKHSKPRPRSHTPDTEDASEPEYVIPEAHHEEREYRKPGHRHRYRETVDTIYGPDSDVDGASTDDGDRKVRRRKHRHRRRERLPDDASSTVAEPESGTESERDVQSRSVRSSSSHGGILDRAKTFGEAALAALGLEEVNKRSRSRSRSRGRGRRDSKFSDEGYDSNAERQSRSRSRLQSNAAQASMIAAAVEAFRARKEPGGVTGSKSLRRVVEAAVTSGAVEKYLDRKGENDKKSNKRVAEAVIAGLAAQRGLNGPRSKRRGDGDERRDPLKDLVASGLIATAGKKFLDYQRSRSQSRPRERTPDSSPERDRPGLDRRRSRSAHVGQALAAVGLGGLAADCFGRSRRDSKDSRRSDYRDDSSSDSSLSDSDLSLDEDAERDRHKRLRRKEIISIALAILAALHVGQAGYDAHEKRAVRKEKLESGKISQDDADRLQRKALLKDATAVGLAIFAATEAVKTFKGMQQCRQRRHEFDNKHAQIEEHRRQKAIEQPYDDDYRPQQPPRPPKGESNRYYSQPGYMGPPPGVRDTPAYPYYPAEGTIPPTAYVAPRDAYTRDGRDIPVVYPSSVTHA